MSEQLPPASAGDETPADIVSHDDEVHRHIGCIVRLASEIEDAATQLLSWLINPSDPQKARPLLNGKRLSELIDLLSQLLPPFTDREAYIGALRSLNAYRDGLAHSTRGMVPKDLGNFRIHWMDNQRRKSRTTTKLDLAEARSIEARHRLVRAILETMMLALIIPSSDEELPSSILSFLRRDTHGIWSHNHTLEAAASVLGGDQM
jgi:hypothetical protein